MEGGEVVAAEDSDTLLGFVLLNEVRASLYSVLELSYGSVPWWVKLLPTSAGGTLLLGGKIRQGTSKQMVGRSMAKMSSFGWHGECIAEMPTPKKEAPHLQNGVC